MGAIIDAARGRWPQVLADLGGLTEKHLSGRHGPCPLCEGTDRFRFDDQGGTGSWFCNQCGGKDQRGGGGSGLELLARKRGWTPREALRHVGRYLDTPDTPEAPRKAPETPWRQPERPPADAPPPALDRGATARWCYRDASGAPLFWILRLELSNGARAYPHVVWLDGGWHRPNKRRDGFSCDWPTPRPLYGLPDLTERPEAPVLVVEGEKTADAARELLPDWVVVTWSNGAKSHGKADWSPLRNRDCWLAPDNDLDGRNAMAAVGDVLRGQGCRVQVVGPPPEATEGWDLADARDWSTAQTEEWLRGAQAVEGKQFDGLIRRRTSDEPKALDAGLLLAMLRVKASDGQTLRYNTFNQTIELNGEAIEGIERFYLKLADMGYTIKKQMAQDCLVEIAKEYKYDPVRMYLEHVEATAEPAYIDQLATTYLRPEDAALNEPTLYDAMIKATLIGAVRRALEPGCKHDTCCVIAGVQGARKSAFWQVLGGPFFSDQLSTLQKLTDEQLKLHRSWIMEWPELDHIMSRGHSGQIKAFITTQRDLFRAPYGAAVEEHPRRGIIVATVNKTDGLLIDDTGNRRFWIIPTTLSEDNQINTAGLQRERDAIWCAAVKAYRRGESSFLPVHLLRQVREENENYVTESPWMAAVQEWIKAPVNAGRPLTTEVLLKEAIQKPVGQQNRADQMMVGDILRRLGYSKTRKLVNGRRECHYTLDP